MNRPRRDDEDFKTYRVNLKNEEFDTKWKLKPKLVAAPTTSFTPRRKREILNETA